MDQAREKGFRDRSFSDSVLSALAVISVVVALSGSVATAAGASWRSRAYFSLAGMVFDLVFSFELFAVLALTARRRDAPKLAACVLAFLSSAVPLAILSGPLLFGWATADFSAAAVRGYAASGGPMAALATASALRLLRLARPYASLYPRPPKALPSKHALIALAAAALAALLACALTDALVLPGYARAEAERRQGVMRAMRELSVLDPSALTEAARTHPDIVALAVNGMTVVAGGADYHPADAMYEEYATVAAWFSAKPVHRASGAAEAAAALCALILTLAYALSSRKAARAGTSFRRGTRAARGQPVGREEMAGVLGKRLP